MNLNKQVPTVPHGQFTLLLATPMYQLPDRLMVLLQLRMVLRGRPMLAGWHQLADLLMVLLQHRMREVLPNRRAVDVCFLRCTGGIGRITLLRGM